MASIDHERGSSAQYLQSQLDEASSEQGSGADQVRYNSADAVCYDSVVDAFAAAQEQLTADDCLVVFGSFFVAGDILKLIKGRPLGEPANVVTTE